MKKNLLIISALITLFASSVYFENFLPSVYLSLQADSSIQNFDITQQKITSPTVLVIEPTSSHKETLLGVTKYFIDLGYTVHMLVSHHDSFKTDVDVIFKNKNVKLFPMKEGELEKIISASVDKYQYVFVTTMNRNYEKIPDKLKNKQNVFFMLHYQTFINDNADIKKLVEQKRGFILTPFSIHDDFLYLNAHYLGESNIQSKNKETRFAVVGLPQTHRRNYRALIEAVRFLHQKRINNFKIVLIGSGSSDWFSENVPSDLKLYFETKGRLDYRTMALELKNTDFLLTLLDEKEGRSAYREYKTTGTVQLMYGSLTPALFETDFATAYRIDETNAVIYQDGNLSQAMEKSIKMSNEEYKILVENLYELKKKVQQASFESLEKAGIKHAL